VPKRFVDGLRSAADHNRFYVGVTSDVPARIDWHNAGRCCHPPRMNFSGAGSVHSIG